MFRSMVKFRLMLPPRIFKRDKSWALSLFWGCTLVYLFSFYTAGSWLSQGILEDDKSFLVKEVEAPGVGVQKLLFELQLLNCHKGLSPKVKPKLQEESSSL